MSNVSLSEFLQQHTAHVKESLTDTILSISDACLRIDQALKKGALAGILGSAGLENVQGETQKKLDVISNEILINALQSHPAVAALASEELETFTPAQSTGEFLVLFDPLDGSSNIDINMCVGTIFSILTAPTGQVKTEDFFQSGRSQVAAGYVLYGPSTLLALTTGQGVHIFTLDPDSKQFRLTASNIQIDQETQEFAINSSNQRHWEAPVKQYINELQQGKSGVRQKDYNMRWVACMVGDVHRILTRGGIFLYPFDSKDPNKAGRLRLMYEANPLGLIIEQAGGKISTGRENILDIIPHDLHQRIPVILGSENEVQRVISYH